MTKHLIAVGHSANGQPYTVESATAQMLAAHAPIWTLQIGACAASLVLSHWA